MQCPKLTPVTVPDDLRKAPADIPKIADSAAHLVVPSADRADGLIVHTCRALSQSARRVRHDGECIDHQFFWKSAVARGDALKFVSLPLGRSWEGAHNLEGRPGARRWRCGSTKETQCSGGTIHTVSVRWLLTTCHSGLSRLVKHEIQIRRGRMTGKLWI
jgi:hypothetical protein